MVTCGHDQFYKLYDLLCIRCGRSPALYVISATRMGGCLRKGERQTQTQTWQSTVLVQKLWDPNYWGCGSWPLPAFSVYFLITDYFSYNNRILFNSLSSCLKMLALITTSLLLCLPHHSSGQLHTFSFSGCFLGGSLLIPCLSLVSSHIFFIAGSFICSSHLEFYLNDFI